MSLAIALAAIALAAAALAVAASLAFAAIKRSDQAGEAKTAQAKAEGERDVAHANLKSANDAVKIAVEDKEKQRDRANALEKDLSEETKYPESATDADPSADPSGRPGLVRLQESLSKMPDDPPKSVSGNESRPDVRDTTASGSTGRGKETRIPRKPGDTTPA